MKVVAGQQAGETGMLLRLQDGVATLFLDSSRQEVRLFARDLTESADIVAGIDRCGTGFRPASGRGGLHSRR